MMPFPNTLTRITKAFVLAASLIAANGFAYAGDSPNYKHDESQKPPRPEPVPLR